MELNEENENSPIKILSLQICVDMLIRQMAEKALSS